MPLSKGPSPTVGSQTAKQSGRTMHPTIHRFCRILAIGCTLLLASQSYAKAPELPQPATDEFHFVVLGDSQFHQPIQFNRIINDVARLQPAFAVQVGDLIRGYAEAKIVAQEWTRFRAQIAPLSNRAKGIAYIPIPGNHDVYGPNKTPDEAVTDLYRQQWGPDYHSFRYRNSAFLVLNTDAVGAPNSIQGAQLRWLAKTLKATKDATHRFVFLHRPPTLLKNAKAVHKLLAKHKVDFVFYGHHHHLHYQQKDGVNYIMTNAAANSGVAAEAAGSFPHFLQVSVRDGQAQVAVIKADAVLDPQRFDPWDNYDLFALTNKLAPSTVTLVATRVKHSKQQHIGPSYALTIPLSNTSRRDVEVYPSCTSADERWDFTPQRIAPIQLAANTKADLVVEVQQQQAGSSESLPECRLDIPFQATTGQWLQHQVKVTTQLEP